MVLSAAHIERLLCVHSNLHGVLRIVQCGSPGVEQERQSQLCRGVLLESFPDGDKVLQRLRHLAALDGEVPRMEKECDPLVIFIMGLWRDWEGLIHDILSFNCFFLTST